MNPTSPTANALYIWAELVIPAFTGIATLVVAVVAVVISKQAHSMARAADERALKRDQAEARERIAALIDEDLTALRKFRPIDRGVLRAALSCSDPTAPEVIAWWNRTAGVFDRALSVGTPRWARGFEQLTSEMVRRVTDWVRSGKFDQSKFTPRV